MLIAGVGQTVSENHQRLRMTVGAEGHRQYCEEEWLLESELHVIHESASPSLFKIVTPDHSGTCTRWNGTTFGLMVRTLRIPWESLRFQSNGAIGTDSECADAGFWEPAPPVTPGQRHQPGAR